MRDSHLLKLVAVPLTHSFPTEELLGSVSRLLVSRNAVATFQSLPFWAQDVQPEEVNLASAKTGVSRRHSNSPCTRGRCIGPIAPLPPQVGPKQFLNLEMLSDLKKTNYRQFLEFVKTRCSNYISFTRLRSCRVQA